MRKKYLLLVLAATVLSALCGYSQNDSIAGDNDSINSALLKSYAEKLEELEKQKHEDSIRKVDLELKFTSLRVSDRIKREEIQMQLNELKSKETEREALKKARIDSLKLVAKGYPVLGPSNDTIFFIYTRIGSQTPKDRANSISRKLEKLYDDDFIKVDSILVFESDNYADIVHKDMIIMSISETDALWHSKTKLQFAHENVEKIRHSIVEAKKQNSWLKIIIRIGLVLLVVASVWFVIWLLNKIYIRLLLYVKTNKDKWLKSLSYKDYTFLSAEQELRIILFFVKALRWITIALLLYLVIPIVFSIFPFTRGWADDLFNLVWLPFRGIIVAVWDYLPNIFTILVIFFVMKYCIRFVKYVFEEIESGKLIISGFHADWAMPTYSIVRFLLYAFMFVMIFPYLPGSDSDIFKGVSVFIGILFSLGSSSAIANMVAGLVITYMRPFKIGDRIKIGDITGDVVEKTLLVTRIRTPKNEEITIPNSSILSGNTTNYSSHARNEGLIVHTTVTIGYDVPWKKTHSALLEAADRCENLLKDPKPFVLQTSLDDFYVSYQLNAYTNDANGVATVYSNLHQNIQDVFNERGIEILSPHYRAQRDGNTTTIPADYLPPDYKAPDFSVSVKDARKD